MIRQEILERILNLPPISSGPIKIMELLRDGKTELSDLIDIIKYSPGLTSSVLRISNSPSYDHSGEIGSIAEALKIMGGERMYKIIASSAFSSLLNKPLSGYDLTSNELLKHSIAVAIIAEKICERLKIDRSDEIFTAALLHDIGKLVLAGNVETDFMAISTRASLNRESFEIAERNILGMDHGELGGMILEIWFCPQRLIIPVRWHHDPDGKIGEYQLVTDIVHVADNLSRTSGIGVGEEGLQYHLSKLALKRLKLKTLMLEGVLSQSMDKYNEVIKRFNK
jgi:putative nucleotidyltransferase with HDIG domain